MRLDGFEVGDVLLAQGEDAFEAGSRVEVALDEVAVVDQRFKRRPLLPSQRAVGVRAGIGDDLGDARLAGTVRAEKEIEAASPPRVCGSAP